jgi:glycosyltransferase involved in cell wall biosynthesis
MKAVYNLLRGAKKLLSSGRTLPCYLLDRDPLILTAFWSDFYHEREAILEALPEGQPVYALFQFGWQRETLEKVRQLRMEAEDVLELRPDLKLVFMCNSDSELEGVQKVGLKGVLIHQNTFLDETRYPVIADARKKYDALYIARITPFKRHELARGIESLKLIGDYKPEEKDHYHKVMKQLPQADWTQKVLAREVPIYCSQARTGLCLSAEEGAMFVSAEYLLCGLPVLSVPNKGGRHTLFDLECTLIVEDSPQAVAEGVQALIDRNLDPHFIRSRTLEMLQPHRARFTELIQSIYDECGVNKTFVYNRKNNCIHKLGLRCSVPLRHRNKRLKRSKSK